MARSHESLWLWVGGGFTAVGAALIGVAGGLDAASRVPYALWTSFPMIVAYVMFGLAVACLACAVRGISFPLAAGAASQERWPSPPQDRPSPSAIIAAAKMSTMSAPQGSAATLETLRGLIAEGKAMQARIADRRGLLTKVPDDLQKSSAAWKTKVSAALASQPGMLAQFEGDPLQIPVGIQGPVGMIYDKIEQGIRVLEVIKQDLGEPV